MDVQLFQHICLKEERKKYFSTELPLYLCINQLALFLWFNFQTLYSFCSIDLCVPLLLNTYLTNYSFIVSHKIGQCDYSNFIVLFTKKYFQLSQVFFYFAFETTSILMCFVLKLQINFGKKVDLILISLIIHKQSMFLRLFRCPLISFYQFSLIDHVHVLLDSNLST